MCPTHLAGAPSNQRTPLDNDGSVANWSKGSLSSVGFGISWDCAWVRARCRGAVTLFTSLLIDGIREATPDLFTQRVTRQHHHDSCWNRRLCRLALSLVR